MTDETVKVYCKLPHGLTLEFGKPGEEDYGHIELVGVLKAGPSAKTFPNRKGEKFGLTIIPASVWAKWLAKNKTLRYVVDKSVFVA